MAVRRLALGVAWLVPAVCFAQTWQPMGPPGGYMQGIVVSPASPNVACTWTGPSLWRSSDKGASWSVVDAGIGISAIDDVAITNTGVTYVLSAGALRRSLDGVTFASFPGLTNGLGFISFAIRGGDDHLVYGEAMGSIYRSVDEGTSWQAFSTTLAMDGKVYRMFVDPNDGGDVYALTYDGILFRTRDGGLSWQQGGTIPVDPYPYVILINPENADVLLYPSVTGVARSTDGGSTWQVIPNLKEDCRATVLGEEPNMTFYSAGDRGGVWRVDLMLAGSAVVSASVTKLDAALPYPRLEALARTGKRLLAAPMGSGVAYFDENLPATSWHLATGISAVYVSSLLNVERAGHPAVLLAGNGDATLGGLTTSTDNGVSWRGIPASTMYGDFVFSLLAYEGRIYAGATLDVFAGTETGDLWTWSALNSPGPDGFVSSLAAVGTGAAVTLFGAASAGDATSGVYATSPATPTPGWQDVSGPLAGADTSALVYDGATLWAASAAGLFRTTPPSMAWTLADGAPADIAALTVRGSRLYAGAPRGLFFTDLATADTWLAVLGPSPVQSLLVDPSTSVLYAGATGIVHQVDASNVAIPVGQGLPPVPVTALAQQGARLFAGTNGRGVYALDLPAALPDGGAPLADAGVSDAALPLDGAVSADAGACACPCTQLRSGCSCQVGARSIPGPSAFALYLLLLATRRRRCRRGGS